MNGNLQIIGKKVFFWDESLSKDYKIFFEKDTFTNSTLKFLMYESHSKVVNVKLNGIEFGNLQEWTVYDSKLKMDEINSVVINGDEYIDFIRDLYRNKLIKIR